MNLSRRSIRVATYPPAQNSGLQLGDLLIRFVKTHKGMQQSLQTGNAMMYNESNADQGPAGEQFN